MLLSHSPDIAAANDLLFFGVNETYAGYVAGDALAKVPTTEKFCCANHARGVDVLADRCGGMKAGVIANGKGSVFDVTVDPNDCAAWKEAILEKCSPDEGKDWLTIGVYMAGKANHKCGIAFLNENPESRAAFATASDLSTDLYDAMADGLNVLFGMDQQSYLQGYLPFSVLTLAATNNQMFENKVIETGPRLVTEPPTEHQTACADNSFKVCANDESNDEATENPQPSPTKQPSAPSSRALWESTNDRNYHVALAVGGFVMAVGGFILAY